MIWVAPSEKVVGSSRRKSRLDEPAAYHAEGVLYLPAEARFDYVLNRPEAENIGVKVNAAPQPLPQKEKRWSSPPRPSHPYPGPLPAREEMTGSRSNRPCRTFDPAIEQGQKL